jgi:hypothetical protein
MKTSSPKTLQDFPKVVVTALRRGPTGDAGYTFFELEGHLDPHINVTTEGPQWFWLLFGKRGSFCASVRSLDSDTRAAVLTFEAREEPDIVGQTLAYLSPYWQAYNVWMVIDPDWGWEKKKFLGIDAVAEDFQSKDTSIIEGREVSVWTKLSPANVHRGQSRYYPATGETPMPESKVRLVPSGWDHEHCELCKSHIDIGMDGYYDPDDHWMCENCYSRYVSPRDLAFVDEL